MMKQSAGVRGTHHPSLKGGIVDSGIAGHHAAEDSALAQCTVDFAGHRRRKADDLAIAHLNPFRVRSWKTDKARSGARVENTHSSRLFATHKLGNASGIRSDDSGNKPY